MNKWNGVNGLDPSLPGLCYGGNLVRKYMTHDELKKYDKAFLDNALNGINIDKGDYPCYIYMWVVPSESHKNGSLVVKIGGSRKSVWGRTENEQSDACESMIMVIPSLRWDSFFHNLLKKNCLDGVIPFDHKNSRHNERYIVRDVVALENLIGWIESHNGVHASGRKERPLYRDSYYVIEETLSESNAANVKGEYANIVWSLPPRWGKTLTASCFIQTLNVRFAFVTSYINTVSKSWKSAINKTNGLENILWVNPDDFKTKKDEDEMLNKMVKHYFDDANNKIVYYSSLTGTAVTDADDNIQDNPDPIAFKNYEYRINLAKRFFKKIGECKIMIMVDEADFGAKCKKQVSKLRNLVKMGKCIATVCMTGTNAESARKIFNDKGCDIFVKRTIPDMWEEVKNNKSENS